MWALMTSGTIPILLMGVAVVKLVESSIGVIKYTEPLNDSVKSPATSV